MTDLFISIDWNEIDTVLLDMDGTLLDLHYDNHFWLEHLPRVVSERDGISLQSAKDAVIPRLRRDAGTLPFYCIDYWSAVFDLDILALKRQAADKIAVREGARTFLNRLRAARKRVVLTTNAHRDTIDMKLDKTGLVSFFETVSSSHDYGFAKEHNQYWHVLARDKNINLDASLLIDDNHEVLESAKSSGVNCVIGVHQPDSRRPALEVGDYPMTNDFHELLNT